MIRKNKTIIFFDADGTLWYPHKTKRTTKPHWVYKDTTIQDPLTHLMITPTTKETLRILRKMGIITIILSTHPQEKIEAYRVINKKVSYFGLEKLFTEVHATRDYHDSKGEYIIKILKKLNIPKTRALMVGDNYPWDYKPARKVGIDALLIESVYMKKDTRIKKNKKTF